MRDIHDIRKYADSIKKQIKGADIISIKAVFNMGTTTLPDNTLAMLIDDIETLCVEVKCLQELQYGE